MNPDERQQLVVLLHAYLRQNGVDRTRSVIRDAARAVSLEAGFNDLSADTLALELRTLFFEQPAGDEKMAQPGNFLPTDHHSWEQIRAYFQACPGRLRAAVRLTIEFLHHPMVNRSCRFILQGLIRQHARIAEKEMDDYLAAVEAAIECSPQSVHGFAIHVERRVDEKTQKEIVSTFYLSPVAAVLWGAQLCQDPYQRKLRASLLGILIKNGTCTCVPVTRDDGTYVCSTLDLICTDNNADAYRHILDKRACHGFAAESKGQNVRDILNSYHNPLKPGPNHKVNLLFQTYEQFLQCNSSAATPAMRAELANYAVLHFSSPHFLGLQRFMTSQTSDAAVTSFVSRHDAFDWKAIRQAPQMQF